MYIRFILLHFNEGDGVEMLRCRFSSLNSYILRCDVCGGVCMFVFVYFHLFLSSPSALIKYIRPVFVSRSDQDSRRKTVEEIKRRAHSEGVWPQVE